MWSLLWGLHICEQCYDSLWSTVSFDFLNVDSRGWLGLFAHFCFWFISPSSMSQQSHCTVTLLSSPQHSACLEQQSSLSQLFDSFLCVTAFSTPGTHSPHGKEIAKKKKRIKNIKLIITLPLILNIYVLFPSLHKPWVVCVTIWLTKQGLLSHFSHTTLCLLDSYLIHSNHIAWEKCKRGHIHINP